MDERRGRFEVNDSLAQDSTFAARDTYINWPGLSLHAPGDEDYWFRADGPPVESETVSVRISFEHDLGDLDLAEGPLRTRTPRRPTRPPPHAPLLRP